MIADSSNIQCEHAGAALLPEPGGHAGGGVPVRAGDGRLQVLYCTVM